MAIHLRACVAVLLVLVCGWQLPAEESKEKPKQTREEKVRGDREKVLADGYWIYNDFQKGLAQAKQTGKPLMVVLRCIPCEQCVKLDEEIMEKDPELRPLMDKYVRVRIVGTNGLDLNLFQYDYDQSFAVFLMNADKVIYGRFGTRSHRTDWTSDVSIEGIEKALEGGLSLHANYPANRNSLVDKQGEAPLFANPEKFPSLKEKYTSALNYEGDVVKSCIHCHQIGDAQKSFFRSQGKPIPDEYLFPYPHPKAIGLILDPTQRSLVEEIVSGSIADKAGLKKGDTISTVRGQPILSIADVQWVLHHAGDTDKVPVTYKRDGEIASTTLDLPAGWRSQDDLSWRVSSWPMRRMTLGGMVLEEASPEQREQAGITDPAKMALRVRFLGRYGDSALALKTGFKVGDILVGYDGHNDLVRETDLLAYAAKNCLLGEKVKIDFVRGNKRMSLTLPMQE